jgi:midasin (ATPase involved in ribosome maturation)
MLKQILWDYRYIILWVLTAVIYVVIMGKEWCKKKALELMLVAKQLSKEKVLSNGQQQQDWVVKALYLVLKKLKIPFVSEEALRPFIHKLYIMAMDKLDDGKLNNSIQ